jgi:hypothetical protein
MLGTRRVVNFFEVALAVSAFWAGVAYAKPNSSVDFDMVVSAGAATCLPDAQAAVHIVPGVP